LRSRALPQGWRVRCDEAAALAADLLICGASGERDADRSHAAALRLGDGGRGARRDRPHSL